MSHLYAIVPILQHIVNLCLTTGDFPISCKSSIVIPLIKKPGLDREMLKNHRPVSNLSFISKVIEKVISIRILGHILNNNIVDSFQSAYRADHSCETALLRVYNDIVTTVGKGNGSFLVLLDINSCIVLSGVWAKFPQILLRQSYATVRRLALNEISSGHIVIPSWVRTRVMQFSWSVSH